MSINPVLVNHQCLRKVHLHGGGKIERPPSSGRRAPVVKLDASLASQAILLATSKLLPILPKGCVVLWCSTN